MKEFLKNIVILVIFAFVFSSLTGCSGTASSEPAKANAAKPSQEQAKSEERKKSDYPPLASKIATAPIELPDGSTITVAGRKGNVVLMNLWGIWCAPCREEMPHLVELQEKFRSNGFQILGLNVGDEDLEPENFDRMKEFANKMKLNYELGRISNETSEEFAQYSKFGGVPLSVLVDREGNARGVFRGGGPAEIKKLKEIVEQVVAE